jgi:hypothetical protein
MSPLVRAGALLTFVAVSVGVATAQAQSVDARVRELNRQAMDAYHDLEIERAEALLLEARDLGERQGASAQPLALTFLNMGVIAIGVHADNGRGLELFEEALRKHPTIRLDPMTSTPQIESVFTLALKRAKPGEPGATTPAVVPLLHQRPVEALAHTPLALFVEPPRDVDVVRVSVSYRRQGEDEFTERSLSRIRRAKGYGIELPCESADGTGVEYYIEAMGPKGATVARAGSADEPLVVPVVDERTVPAPSLPGRKPPATCKVEPPCDPETGCACSDANPCGRGQRCVEGVCEAAPQKGLLRRGGRFFGSVGIAIGSARVKQGSIAASTPPNHPALVDSASAGDPNDYRPSGLYGGYVDNPDNTYDFGTGTGTLNPRPYCDASSGEFCVNLAGSSMVPVFGAVVSGGYWLLEDLAVTASLRLAFRADAGPLKRALITAGAQYRVFHARDRYVPEIAVGGGIGVGQIQIPVNQLSGQVEPMVRSGLGELHVVVPVRFFIVDDVAVEILPMLHMMFPYTTIVPELVVGGHVAF